jgi:hypothetical protein
MVTGASASPTATPASHEPSMIPSIQPTRLSVPSMSMIPSGQPSAAASNLPTLLEGSINPTVSLSSKPSPPLATTASGEPSLPAVTAQPTRAPATESPTQSTVPDTSAASRVAAWQLSGFAPFLVLVTMLGR